MFKSQKKLGVLVTSISKKIPLLQSVKNAALSINKNAVLHGCDSNPGCIGRYFVDYFWQTPSLSESAFELIRDYCRHHSIQAIIPTRNGELDFFSRHSAQFKAEGIHVMVSPLLTIQICLDKMSFYEFLKTNGFPTIPTAKRIEGVPGKRFVVKEQFGAGSVALGLNLDRNDAIRAASQMQDPIFQPFIEGQEYSVDVYRNISGKVMGAIARSRDVIVNGESQVTTTVKKPELEVGCAKIADELDIYGHVVFQAIEAPDGSYHIIECNPRFGGASTASLAAGLDSFKWFLLESQCAVLEKYPFKRIEGEIKQVRYPADLIIKQ